MANAHNFCSVTKLEENRSVCFHFCAKNIYIIILLPVIIYILLPVIINIYSTVEAHMHFIFTLYLKSVPEGFVKFGILKR